MQEADGHADKEKHAPPRVLGLPAVIAITYFCVSGGAYGLEGMSELLLFSFSKLIYYNFLIHHLYLYLLTFMSFS